MFGKGGMRRPRLLPTGGVILPQLFATEVRYLPVIEKLGIAVLEPGSPGIGEMIWRQ
jgi:hypothetical protein